MRERDACVQYVFKCLFWHYNLGHLANAENVSLNVCMTHLNDTLASHRQLLGLLHWRSFTSREMKVHLPWIIFSK